MIRGAGAVLVLCLLGASSSHAQTLIRPQTRPDATALDQPMPSPVRPPPRPEAVATVAAGPMLRPPARPDLPDVDPSPADSAPARVGVLRTIFGTKGGTIPDASPKGAICGDADIRGTAIPRIEDATSGCGIDLPVRVTDVAGVHLSPAATLNCDATRTLKTWITTVLKPAFRFDRVTELRVYASYACRGRNNVKGAKISEHAKGNAIDIGEITTARRGTLTVQNDFKGARGSAIRKAYKGACGIFGTTLGPGSDGYHENHMHFDIARYRSGSYCH